MSEIGHADDLDKTLTVERVASILTKKLAEGEETPRIGVRVPSDKTDEYAAELTRALDEHFDKSTGIEGFVAHSNPGKLTVWAVRKSEADR